MPVFKCPDKYFIDGKAMELVKGYQPAGKFVPLEERVQGMLKLTLEDGRIIKRKYVSGVVERKVRLGVVY